MEKKWNEHPELGELPFRSISKIELSINGLRNSDDAAFLQYQLLARPEIVRCHVEYAEKNAVILFNPLDVSSEEILKMIPDPFSAKIENEKEIPYTELLKSGFHL
jgi:hypothetical protein